MYIYTYNIYTYNIYICIHMFSSFNCRRAISSKVTKEIMAIIETENLGD